jgi:hypothetical protein
MWLRVPNQMGLLDATMPSSLTESEAQAVDKVIKRYSAMSDFDLKRVCYLSRPMRELLRLERRGKLNLFNVAVLPYKAAGKPK